MAVDRLLETLKIFETINELSNSRFLSPETRSQLEGLKARIESEIAEMKRAEQK